MSCFAGWPPKKTVNICAFPAAEINPAWTNTPWVDCKEQKCLGTYTHSLLGKQSPPQLPTCALTKPEDAPTSLTPLLLPLQVLLLQRRMGVFGGETDVPRQLHPHPRVRPQPGVPPRQGQHHGGHRVRPRHALLRRHQSVERHVFGFFVCFCQTGEQGRRRGTIWNRRVLAF